MSFYIKLDKFLLLQSKYTMRNLQNLEAKKNRIWDKIRKIFLN